MAKKKPTLASNSMQYGGITGLALFIVFVVATLIDMTKGVPVMLLQFTIQILGIYLGTKFYRDHIRNGNLTYGQGLKSGTLIVFFSAIITGFVLFLYLRFVDASALEKMAQLQEQELINKGYTDEQLEQYRKVSEVTNSPTGFAILNVIGNTLLGFIFSLIISAFLKKGNDTFEDFVAQNQ